MNYENPTPLGPELAQRRIFSPFAYHLVRTSQAVPVVTSEAARLAAFYPIVWRKGDHGLELVALRSLLINGVADGAHGVQATALLPLLCQAYPFLLLSETSDPAFGYEKGLDDTIVEAPTDVGAPICMPDGRPTRATSMRFGYLETFGAELATTRAIGVWLKTNNLFEDWPLKFDDGHGGEIFADGMMVIRPAAFETGALAPLLAEFGVTAALLLGCHRLSLFRAGVLLSLAKTAIAAKLLEIETAAS